MASEANFREPLPCRKMLSPVSWAWTASDAPVMTFFLEWTLLLRKRPLIATWIFFFNAIFKKLEAGPQPSPGVLQKPRTELLGSLHFSLISGPRGLLFEWITAFLY